jgi:hypothetical protein
MDKPLSWRDTSEASTVEADKNNVVNRNIKIIPKVTLSLLKELFIV